MSKTVNAGIVTAYGAAVRGGYEGTYAQFCADLGKLADVLSEFLGFSVSIETLAEGEPATANYNGGILSLGIPRGNTGNGIQSIVLNADYTLTVTYTNGNTWTSGSIRGQVGATPHLTIGTVQTLEPGQSATAEITGTDENPVLNLGIPQGQAGASDAGAVTYNSETAYNDGTVGKAVSDLEDTVSTTQIINTASGAIASFDDGADSMPIRKLVAQIEPVQDLHGYANPWPAGGGKNKACDIFSQYTKPDNYYILPVDLSASSTWQFHSTQVGSKISGIVFGIVKDGDRYSNFVGLVSAINSDGVTFSYNINVDSSFVSPKLVCYCSGETQFNQIFANYHIQLEAGSIATSYAPFENLCPISGWTEAEIEQAGKNLFGGIAFANAIVSKVQDAVIDTDAKTVTYTAARVNGVVLFDKFKPDTRYTVRINCTGVSNLIFVYSDGNTQTIDANAITVSSAGRSVVAIRGTWVTGSTVATYEDFGVFEGVLTADDFVPYTGNQISVTFPTTIYGGEDEVISGKLKNTMKKKVLDGSENWAIDTDRNGRKCFYIMMSDLIHKLDFDYLGSIFASNMKTIKVLGGSEAAQVDSIAITGYGYPSTNNYLYILVNPQAAGFENITTADALKAWLAQNNTEVVYRVEEPTEYDLTPQTMETLYGTNNIWSSTGDIQTCEYPADTKLYIDGKLAELQATILENIGG